MTQRTIYKLGDVIVYKDMFGFYRQGIIGGAMFFEADFDDENPDGKWTYYAWSRWPKSFCLKIIEPLYKL